VGLADRFGEARDSAGRGDDVEKIAVIAGGGIALMFN
jgi:hypothetical protein